MYKDKGKQRAATKDRVRRYRDKQKGVTEVEGVTSVIAGEDIPDILDKLTDKVWRSKLEKICHAFKSSHHPDYSEMCWLGDTNLSVVCDLVECTR